MADINGEVAICGGGLQDRNVSCLLKEGRRPVEASFCSHLPQLPRVQRYAKLILVSSSIHHFSHAQLLRALYQSLPSWRLVFLVEMRSQGLFIGSTSFAR